MRSDMNILFKNLYAEQVLVSIAFQTVGPPLEQNSNFKKFDFQW